MNSLLNAYWLAMTQNPRQGKLISSYHVQFIESHHGHQPEQSKCDNAETPWQSTTTPSVTTQSEPTIIISTQPTQYDNSDDCLLYTQNSAAMPVPLPANVVTPLPEQPNDPPTPPDLPACPSVNGLVPQVNPIQVDGPHCSSWIQQVLANPPQQGRLDKAVQESCTSADQVTAAQKINQQAFWEYANILTSLGMVNNEVDKLLQFLWPDSDLCFNITENLADNLPNTWDEAQQSPEADTWLAAYQEELKSLKDMKVYDLVVIVALVACASTQRVWHKYLVD